MTKIKEFTPANCQQLEEEVTAAVSAIAEKYGVEVQVLDGKLSADAATFVPRCQFSLPPRKETVASLKEEQDYLQYAEGFGLRAGWLGREFKRGNFTYKIVGLRVDAPKDCIVLQRSDGSRCYEDGKAVTTFLGV